MKEIVVENPIKQSPLLVVELVGPAGAGKTTLSRALSLRSDRIQVGSEVELRKLRYVPVFVHNMVLLLPVILRRSWHGRWFTWEELKALVYLRGWHGVLRQEANQPGRAVLLDHGPVFKLATLNEFGPESLKDPIYQPWWNNMFRQWASTLDVVIWLDAPDPILEKRINSRNQRHAVKGKSAPETSQFLARYRVSYEQILAKLKSFGGPVLFQFDTNQTPIEQIVDEVLLTVNRLS